MSEKQEPIIPKDEYMAETFKEVLKADNYIVITIKSERNGVESRIHHEMSVEETARELSYWASVFKDQNLSEKELEKILRERGIS